MTRVSLTSGTSTQLIIDTSGLMTLGTDDLQSAQLLNAFTQLDIRTTAGHVRCDGDMSHQTCIRDDLSLELMELGIQHLMLHALLLQQLGQFFGRIDIYRTDQHRLTLLVGLNHILDDGVQLLLLGLEDRIILIDTCDRKVCGNYNNVHAVDLTELVLLRLCRTGHAGFLLIFIEEVLEGNGRQSLGLALYLYIFLCFDTLMQTVIEPTSRHDTSGELIYDQYFIVLYHVILIPVHQRMGLQSLQHGMLDLDILGIRQVFDMEELLDLGNTLFCKNDILVLLIYKEITVFLYGISHNGIHLTDLGGCGTTLHPACDVVAHFIDIRGLSALSGNDQRRTRLIDQDGVHLVDDAVMQRALNQLLLVDDHVITQVIKAQLVICDIGDIAVVGFPALIIGIRIQDHPDRQTQPTVNRTHPLSITLSQIVIDRDDMYTFPVQRIQVGRKGGYKGLTFTGTHLGDTTLMQDHATDQLHTEGFHAKYTIICFTHYRKCLRKDIIQSLAFFQTFLEFDCFRFQFLIGERLHLLIH